MRRCAREFVPVGGAEGQFVVIRDKVQTDVTVTTVESNVQSDAPVVGITATGIGTTRRSPSIWGNR